MRDDNDARLHELAGRIGQRAAERLDVEAMAQAVIEQLRQAPRASRWSWRQPAWLRIAAAVVVLAGGALMARRVLPGGPSNGHGVAHFVTDDLSDLSAEQLAEVLSTLDQTLDVGSTTLPEAGLEDLDARQLRAVLRSLEG
ncbi:MAG: hypothetical protein ACREMC_09485 [Gemmatimonadales bacterium]